MPHNDGHGESLWLWRKQHRQLCEGNHATHSLVRLVTLLNTPVGSDVKALSSSHLQCMQHVKHSGHIISAASGTSTTYRAFMFACESKMPGGSDVKALLVSTACSTCMRHHV